ncbi:hypothetical protein CRENBAI_017712 [Crenichthys baileyi]|uniref:Uncharacterized protein n=1 Tax=Crenichthys baileyi TaxID=28760 RepID=A0AAV9R7T4_9TELE
MKRGQMDGWKIRVKGDKLLLEQAVDVLQSSPEKMKLVLLWDSKDPVSSELTESLLQCLQNIHSLRFRKTYRTGAAEQQKHNCETLEVEEEELLLELMLKAASNQPEDFPSVVDQLLTLFSAHNEKYDIMLEFYHLVRSQSISSVVPLVKPFFQSNSEVWSIKLSEGKTSVLLEALKFSPGEKEVQIRGFSHGESEVVTFLQCLPYISQLSFAQRTSEVSHQTRFLKMCVAKATEHQNKVEMMDLLTSVCSYETFPIKDQSNTEDYHENIKYQSDFLLHLYAQLKDLEKETGLSLLPSLQSVFQVAPLFWIIKLSETKTSILLEMLKLQPEKKPVKLMDCSREESEVRSFLQCLPYISQLSFEPQIPEGFEETRFLVDLFCAAADREHQTGEKILEQLASVYKYQTSPLKQKWFDFLLDLFTFELKTRLDVVPSPHTKSSILLNVLKLQSEKEQRSSQTSTNIPDQTRLLVDLFCAAAEREHQTGEKILELLASVWTYETFISYIKYINDGNDFMDDDDFTKYRCYFLLDLYSQMKDYETKTGLSLLPSLQSVFQSAPPVWIINLSEIKTSILLEMLKLQPEKKPMKLMVCSREESEVRSFLQCLPYISQLSSCWCDMDDESYDADEETRFLVDLFCAAAEREHQTGEKILEQLASVCRYETFISTFDFMDDDDQSDLLLDLYSQMKDCETKTGLSLLPSLQSVFQVAPLFWIIKLSETKTSILLEMLKLQPEKKPVKLMDCSREESEVRSFLQCLPYISQLSFEPQIPEGFEETRFLVDLFCAAADREHQTGEKILEQLASVYKYQTSPLKQKWFDFLLDLFTFELKTRLDVVPSPHTKSSILLNVLKLQSEKEQRSSQTSTNIPDQTRLLVDLFCAAAEREHQTGEKILELLASVWTYETFISYIKYINDGNDFMDDDDFTKYRCYFLRDLYSQMKGTMRLKQV